jgi:hypothetical protein
MHFFPIQQKGGTPVLKNSHGPTINSFRILVLKRSSKPRTLFGNACHEAPFAMLASSMLPHASTSNCPRPPCAPIASKYAAGDLTKVLQF